MVNTFVYVWAGACVWGVGEQDRGPGAAAQPPAQRRARCQKPGAPPSLFSASPVSSVRAVPRNGILCIPSFTAFAVTTGVMSHSESMHGLADERSAAAGLLAVAGCAAPRGQGLGCAAAPPAPCDPVHRQRPGASPGPMQNPLVRRVEVMSTCRVIPTSSSCGLLGYCRAV